MTLRLYSHAEQTAKYLRTELKRGRWQDEMPGVHQLKEVLSVNHNTLHAALQILEKEGTLIAQGHGKPRRIAYMDELDATGFEVCILPYDKGDANGSFLSPLSNQLQLAGFSVKFATKSLQEMRMRADLVARYVKKHPADAWVVCAGSSEVIEWFSEQSFPALAMYGSFGGLPIAAAHTIHIPTWIKVARHLVDLGHRKIVMFARKERRKPQPGRPEQAFLDELEAAGIKTGDYNLPDWDENRDGLQHRLSELFRLSPPTVLIFQETPIYTAARMHIAELGITAPRDVSLITSESDASFKWSKPTPAQVAPDHQKVVRRIVRWATNIAKGKEDRRQVGSPAIFMEGETIGPAPKP